MKKPIFCCRYKMRMACYVVEVEHYLKLKWQKEKNWNGATRLSFGANELHTLSRPLIKIWEVSRSEKPEREVTFVVLTHIGLKMKKKMQKKFSERLHDYLKG